MTSFTRLTRRLGMNTNFNRRYTKNRGRLVRVAIRHRTRHVRHIHRHLVTPHLISTMFLISIRHTSLRFLTRLRRSFQYLIPVHHTTSRRQGVRLTRHHTRFTRITRPRVRFTQHIVVFLPLLQTRRVRHSNQTAHNNNQGNNIIVRTRITTRPSRLRKVIHTQR